MGETGLGVTQIYATACCPFQRALPTSALDSQGNDTPMDHTSFTASHLTEYPPFQHMAQKLLPSRVLGRNSHIHPSVSMAVPPAKFPHLFEECTCQMMHRTMIGLPVMQFSPSNSGDQLSFSDANGLMFENATSARISTMFGSDRATICSMSVSQTAPKFWGPLSEIGGHFPGVHVKDAPLRRYNGPPCDETIKRPTGSFAILVQDLCSSFGTT